MSIYQEIDADPYVSFELDKLVEGARLPFDVYIRDKSVTIPLFNTGTMFNSAARAILREKGIKDVYVRSGDGDVLEQYLAQKIVQQGPFPDPEVFRHYVAEKDANFLIDRSLLVPGTRVMFSLFVLQLSGLKPLLQADDKSPGIIDERILSAPGDVMIRPTDMSRYYSYLDSLVRADDSVRKDHLKIKAGAIKENSKLILKDLLDEPRSGAKIKESISAVNRMVDCILDHKGTMYDLLSLRTHDYYTYTHSVNVAVLSVGLGMAMGLQRSDIEKLGIGAMLHDVGKCTIPLSIINKPGRLDDEEFRIIKTHVEEGEKILRENKEIPEESFAAVSQHHERLSGKGYPYNKSGQDIQPFGKITSIVDCYDALTTQRIYQPARTPFFALSIITKEVGDYDMDYLRAFIKMLGEIRP